MSKDFIEMIEKLEEMRTDELIDGISKTLKNKDKEIKELRNENEQLRNEAYKDNEFQRLKEHINGLNQIISHSFPISEEEYEKINKWQEEHIKTKHNSDSYAGAIGGRYTYEFIPTSIGIIGKVRCSCGEEFVFSELD